MSSYPPIISKTPYKNSFFPKVPSVMQGRAILLYSSEKGIVICINDRVTPREIYVGKFDEKIEIDITKTTISFTVTVPSLNEPFLFDVTITAIIQIIDPLAFYLKGIFDIAECVKPHLLPTIRRVARKYSVVDYSDMDDALASQFSSKKYNYEDTGIEYVIHDVTCTPNANAREHIHSISANRLKQETEKQKILTNTIIEKYKASNASTLTGTDMITNIFKDVVAGQLSSAQALKMAMDFTQSEGMQKVRNTDTIIDLINKLKESDLITDNEAAEYIRDNIKGLPSGDGMKKLGFPSLEEADAVFNDMEGDKDMDGDAAE
ncbi:hypothetical protein [Candidatus Formimonas warabiya]|uniref:Band 7 domain-containing protein n=1 Tax=Formimonas warabiya TaxID=1761012 RepID=A0A3G1KWV8_FORW1|nr:hypothetical protein [Candidatus Formimonas warabiya]ATW26932.1 hypothetical protein DCMF_21165 [Candidatus Formimonas warabiya]